VFDFTFIGITPIIKDKETMLESIYSNLIIPISKIVDEGEIEKLNQKSEVKFEGYLHVIIYNKIQYKC